MIVFIRVNAVRDVANSIIICIATSVIAPIVTEVICESRTVVGVGYQRGGVPDIGWSGWPVRIININAVVHEVIDINRVVARKFQVDSAAIVRCEILR